MKNIKRNNGITLIALVITIIVLLILAGVSVATILSDGGIITNASESAQKTRAGKIIEQISLIISENEIAKYTGGEKTTKEKLVEKLFNDKLITQEEADILKDEDIITIGGIEIDFSGIEVEGYKYIGRKYLLMNYDGTYIVCGEDSILTVYDRDNNEVMQLSSENVTFDSETMTIFGTGLLDNIFYVSRNGHYMYIKEENGREYTCFIEEGYCKHNLGYCDYNFDNIENPKVNCQTCMAEIPCKYINGVIYSYNTTLGIKSDMVDTCYDENINGYCAYIWDKTLETINFEEQIDGVNVTKIDGFQSITDNTIPAVKTVNIPKNVKDMSRAFTGYTSLTTVSSIPSSVEKMQSAFLGCTSLVVAPDMSNATNVKNMNNAFSGCTSLTTVSEIPNNVENMNYAFYECKSLIVAPNMNNATNVKSMDNAFSGCTALTTVSSIPNSNLSMRETFSRCKSLTTVSAIPSNVEDMSNTFSGCTSLVVAPDISNAKNLKNMVNAFRGCTALTTVSEIPSSVEDMGSAFKECTSLVVAPDMSNATNVKNMYSTFYGCTALTTVSSIPSSVENMHIAFSGCTALTTVSKIPNSVVNMMYAFSDCTSLVVAPDMSNATNVKNMYGTFYRCTALTTVSEIPNNVENMEITFNECISLTGKISIPCTVNDKPISWNTSAKAEYYHANGCTGKCGY